MIDIKYLRNNPEQVKAHVAQRFVDVDIDELVRLDKQVNELQRDQEALLAKRKELAKGKTNQAAGKKIKDEIKKVGEELILAQSQRDALLRQIPNFALADVPIGEDETSNKEIKKAGSIRRFTFEPKDYLSLADADINISQAAKVSGTRFAYLAGEIAWLQHALVNYVFGILKKHNFTPLITPVLIKTEAMQTSGKLDARGEDGVKDMYYLPDDDLYLIGTAEQSIGPFHMDQILPAEELPLRYFAYEPSFRREAGSYGKDTGGILRVHQFDKVEMYVFCEPEQSPAELERLVAIEEEIMDGLGLPYRLVVLSSGDMAFQAAKTIDVEAWIPSQDKYRELMSASTCTDWQARRLQTRYKSKATRKNEYVHTLNATAMALGRMIIAVVENYQTEDGTFTWPTVLESYR